MLRYHPDTLLQAPKKKHTKTIVAFWGRYEWPVDYYPRFRHCQGLEVTADDTPSMTHAFSHLSKVTELGLSIDNGLGWLSGPDVTWRRKLCRIKPEVFSRLHSGLTFEEEMQNEAWEQLLRHLFELNHPDEKFRALCKLKSLKDLPYMFPPLPSSTRHSSDGPREEMLGGIGGIASDVFSPDLNLRRSDSPTPILQPSSSDSDQNSGHSNREQFTYVFDDLSDGPPEPYKPNPKWESYWHPGDEIVPGHITPNKLTQGQKEWLLETDWAQQAFLSSYTLSIIDNQRTMRNVRVLYIARIPSKYLDMLRRHDFWSALENLKALSIYVTPDWHDIIRKGEDHVWLHRLLPSSSITRFYNLLSEFISPLARVERLRIGWSEGGEYAPGMFARNQHVMPAPVVPAAGQMYPHVSAQMALGQQPPEVIQMHRENSVPHLLDLPYVVHLTLCNCWISFRNLIDLTRNMRSNKLQEIWFDSVSLSSLDNISKYLPSVANQNPPPSQQQQQQQPPPQQPPNGSPTAATASDDSSSPSPTTAEPPHSDPLLWTSDTSEGSWMEYIDRFTPGKTLDQQRYEAGYTPYYQPTLSSAKRDRLDEMHFYTCGYARVLIRALDRPLSGPPTQGLSNRLKKRQKLIAPEMTKHVDRHLGYIISNLRYGEMEGLVEAFGMVEGWPSNCLENKFECVADGQPVGGTGRFTGILKREE